MATPSARTPMPARSRLLLIITVVVVVGMLLFAILNYNSKEEPKQLAAGASTTAPPSVRTVPGTADSQRHDALVTEENRRAIEQARSAGSTSLPTLTSSPSTPADPLDGLSFPTVPERAPPKAVEEPQLVPNVTRPRPTQAPPTVAPAPVRNPQDRQREVDAKAAHIAALMEKWGASPAHQEFAYAGTVPEETSSQANNAPAPSQRPPSQDPFSGIVAGSSTSTQDAGPDEADGRAAFVQAGTIVPAVLLTPINSDTPGPVLAQVTAGPLKGARAIGSFRASEEQVVVEFRTLSLPSAGRSFSIDAYAVDVNGAPGLASDVNHHYLRRFGLLAAAAFIEGYGQAAARANTTVVTTPLGGIIEQRGELTSDQVRKAAMGQVGSEVGSALAQEARVRPTIRVEDESGRGVPVGLLFMSDF